MEVAVFIIVIIVLGAYVYFQTMLKLSRYSKKGRRGSIGARQVAGDVKILYDSFQIISNTKVYSVKTSRIDLVVQVVSRLNSYQTRHITHNETWEQLVISFKDYAHGIKNVDKERNEFIESIISERTPLKCPYCGEDTFLLDSKALKCSACSKKAARFKYSKTYKVMLTQEEIGKIKSYEEVVLQMFPTIEAYTITISPEAQNELNKLLNRTY